MAGLMVGGVALRFDKPYEALSEEERMLRLQWWAERASRGTPKPDELVAHARRLVSRTVWARLFVCGGKWLA